jgi:D-methionine transport system ATP-binding protein
VEQTRLEVNILSANTRSVGGIGYGQMILELPSDRKDSQTAVDFFRKNGLSVSEVN